MLIRPGQLAALRETVDRELAIRIADALVQRIVSGTIGVPRALLHERAYAGVRLARTLGLENEGATTVFVNLLFEFHPGYYAHPDAAALLADRSQTEEQRIRALLQWIAGGSWNGSDRFGPPCWP